MNLIYHLQIHGFEMIPMFWRNYMGMILNILVDISRLNPLYPLEFLQAKAKIKTNNKVENM